MVAFGQFVGTKSAINFTIDWKKKKKKKTGDWRRVGEGKGGK